MSTPKINLLSRTALLLLITLSIVFAAACGAEEPVNNSNSQTAPSSSPSASPSPSGETGSAPANSVSPAVSPSPAASPSPSAKTKSPK